jgi:hypothetical protein
MMEAIIFSGTSVLTRVTRRHIPEDDILQQLICCIGNHTEDLQQYFSGYELSFEKRIMDSILYEFENSERPNSRCQCFALLVNWHNNRLLSPSCQ